VEVPGSIWFETEIRKSTGRAELNRRAMSKDQLENSKRILSRLSSKMDRGEKLNRVEEDLQDRLISLLSTPTGNAL
jgi:hypothetical protein